MNADVSDLEASRMPFLAHLRELRDRVRRAAIVFVAAMIGCWFIAEDVYIWLAQPLFNAWRAYPNLGTPNMVFSTVTEPFWVYMSVAMWSALFVSSPMIFWQLWGFVAPGLYRRERRMGLLFAGSSVVFFVGGALFCYYLALPQLFHFLLGYAKGNLNPMLQMTEYMDQTRNTMLAFGAVFELPLLLYFLALVGLVTHRSLWKFNRWFVVLSFIVGAILTPSPDVVSQLIMALPMIALYNLSIVAAWTVSRRREREASAAAAADT